MVVRIGGFKHSCCFVLEIQYEFSGNPVYIEIGKKSLLVPQDRGKQFFFLTLYTLAMGFLDYAVLFKTRGRLNILLLCVCSYISVLKGKHRMPFKLYMPKRTQIWIVS